MNKHLRLEGFIADHPDEVMRVVDFDADHDRLLLFDFTSSNRDLGEIEVSDTQQFSHWVSASLQQCSCRYGIGGYMENRTLYARSAHFNGAGEPRRLHLGIDIWAEAGTPVYAAFNGSVHSFNDNDHFGDYGPTVILEHHLDGLQLFTLYGHLSRVDLLHLRKGQIIQAGQQIGSFGHSNENGSWPPHLHFQLMFDIGEYSGDYPGVGYFSKKAAYLENIPDPAIVLRFPDRNIVSI